MGWTSAVSFTPFLRIFPSLPRPDQLWGPTELSSNDLFKRGHLIKQRGNFTLLHHITLLMINFAKETSGFLGFHIGSCHCKIKCIM